MCTIPSDYEFAVFYFCIEELIIWMTRERNNEWSLFVAIVAQNEICILLVQGNSHSLTVNWFSSDC